MRRKPQKLTLKQKKVKTKSDKIFPIMNLKWYISVLLIFMKLFKFILKILLKSNELI